MDKVTSIFVVHIDDRGVVNLQKLGAKSWQHCHCPCVQHQDQEGVVVGPGEVIHLQIGLALAIEGRVVLGCHKFKQLHHADKLCLLVYKEDLAVDFVDAVDCDREKTALIIAFADQVAVNFGRRCRQKPQVLNLCRHCHFVD